MKFVHCADLHLDTAFSGLGDGKRAAIRQAELRRTFLSVVELAKTADVLLIAGDLFDQDSVEPETISVLKQGFASLTDTQVLIVAGNHDPLTENSYYHLTDFSDNVHIFGTSLSCVTVAGCDVYGISFSRSIEEAPLLEELPTKGERPGMLLIHGDLGGYAYNPISRDAVSRSGLSYVALGHIHAHTQEKVGATLCAYPGCPEGRGFDELGAKGVIVGEITEDGVTTEFVPLCERQYIEETVDVSGLATHEEMAAAIRQKQLTAVDLYKIILVGETELVPDTDILKEAFNECFFIKIYDRTKRPLDLEGLLAENGVRAMFAEKLKEGLSGEEAELYRKALELGLAALEGRRVKLS